MKIYAIIDSKGGIMAPIEGLDFSDVLEETRKENGWYDCVLNQYEAEEGKTQAIATDITRYYDEITVHYPLYPFPLKRTGQLMAEREIARSTLIQEFINEVNKIEGNSLTKLQGMKDSIEDYVEQFREIQYPQADEEGEE